MIMFRAAVLLDGLFVRVPFARGAASMFKHLATQKLSMFKKGVGCAGWQPLLCCDIETISAEADRCAAKKGGNTGICSRPLMDGSFLFACIFHKRKEKEYVK